MNIKAFGKDRVTQVGTRLSEPQQVIATPDSTLGLAFIKIADIAEAIKNLSDKTKTVQFQTPKPVQIQEGGDVKSITEESELTQKLQSLNGELSAILRDLNELNSNINL